MSITVVSVSMSPSIVVSSLSLGIMVIIIVTPWLRNFFLPKEHSCLLSYSPCHVAVVFMSVHSLQFHVQPIISSKVILLYHNTKLFSITSLDLPLPIFPSKLPVSATYSDFLFLITCPKKCKLSFLFFT